MTAFLIKRKFQLLPDPGEGSGIKRLRINLGTSGFFLVRGAKCNVANQEYQVGSSVKLRTS